MDRIHATALALHRLTKPTIAAVDGLAAGAGMSLALGCDLVLASTRARFSAIFVRRGLSIDFGLSWLLPRLVGVGKAKELALLGDFVDADEALRIGLVARVVNPDELTHAVDRALARLAEGPTVAIRSDVDLLQSSFQRTFDEAIDAESAPRSATSGPRDAAEAIAAFLEKRDAAVPGSMIPPLVRLPAAALGGRRPGRTSPRCVEAARPGPHRARRRPADAPTAPCSTSSSCAARVRRRGAPAAARGRGARRGGARGVDRRSRGDRRAAARGVRTCCSWRASPPRARDAAAVIEALFTEGAHTVTTADSDARRRRAEPARCPTSRALPVVLARRRRARAARGRRADGVRDRRGRAGR